MPNPRPLFRDVRLLYLVYVPALLAGILLLPLWLPEILQLAGAADPQTVKLSEAIDLSPQATRLVQMLNWSAASPGESPLGYLTQFPFVCHLWLRALGGALAIGPTRHFECISLLATGAARQPQKYRHSRYAFRGHSNPLSVRGGSAAL